MKFSSRHHPSASAAIIFPTDITCRDRDVCKMGQLLRSPTCQGPGGTHVDCPLISYLELVSAGRDVCNLHIYCSSSKLHPIDILSWNCDTERWKTPAAAGPRWGSSSCRTTTRWRTTPGGCSPPTPSGIIRKGLLHCGGRGGYAKCSHSKYSARLKGGG